MFLCGHGPWVKLAPHPLQIKQNWYQTFVLCLWCKNVNLHGLCLKDINKSFNTNVAQTFDIKFVWFVEGGGGATSLTSITCICALMVFGFSLMVFVAFPFCSFNLASVFWGSVSTYYVWGLVSLVVVFIWWPLVSCALYSVVVCDTLNFGINPIPK